jgi:predicted metal-binding membrane protein
MTGMPVMSSGMTMPRMTAMMVAMMLPSVAPNLWRYHRQQRATLSSRATWRTILFASAYTSVWVSVSVMLVWLDAGLSTMRMSGSPNAVILSGVVLLCAGALQRSRWKAKQLSRCRELGESASRARSSSATSLFDGYHLGVHCCLSCAAPMAVLCVGGLMDGTLMALVATAITAERVMSAGAQIARLTGGITLVAGSVVCIVAIGFRG